MSDEEKKSPQASMTALKTRPFERNLALTKLGVSAGARIAAHEFANLFRGGKSRGESDKTFYVQQAHKLADELGRLKGSIMKVGQMLSLYGQYFLPPEAVDVLSGLQDDTPPVAFSALQPTLRRALGKGMAELEIDPVPLASASLGQVHRARRRRDGRDLVVKVQYPGVADAIDSDITTLQRLIAITRLAPSGLSLDPVYAEVREMLHREVDYQAEVEHTLKYAQLLKDDPRYVVPEVFDEYCSDRVMVLSYEPGVSARDATVQALPPETRNALASSALELYLRELFDWGMVQTDPHFGNYKVRVDGTNAKMVLLDFGATRLFGRGFVDGYREMLRGAVYRDKEAVWRGAEATGVIDEDFPADIRMAFYELCELVVEPLRGPYDWGASNLPRRAGAMVARNALTRWFRIPPREIVFLHRRLAGVFILLAALRADFDARPVVLPKLA